MASLSGRPASGVTRREAIGFGMAGVAALLAACSDDDGAAGFGGRVLVVGAGPAGMTAANLLTRRGVDVTILEAQATAGGRIAHDRDFADFPISLGGEWLHVEDAALKRIADDPDIEVDLVRYRPDDPFAFYDPGSGEYSDETAGEFDDAKFVASSWLGFFEEHVLPSIADRIVFDTEVVGIDLGDADTITISDASGTTWNADRVILTVPLKLLQLGRITFTPPLPDAHVDAIADANVWGGLKAFIEFGDRFFPAFVEFPDSETAAGQRAYYDAAWGQDSDHAVLGLFSVGEQAEAYQALDPGDELRDHMLAELDEVFDGRASQTYVRHRVQNWNEQPYARAAYLADVADATTSSTLSQPVEGRLFFAGEAFTRHDDWGGVHDAARSARDAVDDITG